MNRPVLLDVTGQLILQAITRLKNIALGRAVAPVVPGTAPASGVGPVIKDDTGRELVSAINDLADNVFPLNVGIQNYIINSEPWILPASSGNDSSVWASSGTGSFTRDVGHCDIAFTAADEYLQIQRNYRYGQYASQSSVALNEFNDGDPFVLAIEVESASPFYWAPNISLRATPQSPVIQPWATTDALVLVSASSSYKQILMMGTIPSGWSAVIQSGPFMAVLVNYFKSTTAQTIKVRKMMLSKGKTRTDWAPAPKDISDQTSLGTIDMEINSQGHLILTQTV